MQYWVDESETEKTSNAAFAEALQLVCVIGRSGAGHSTALRHLDDVGFTAVDNMPLALIDQLISLVVETKGQKLAIGVDLRTSGFDAEAIDRLASNISRQFGDKAQIIYVTASDDELFNRYKATRRRHPLMDKEGTLEAAIAAETDIVYLLEEKADIVIDSTGKSPHIFCEELSARLELSLDQHPVLSIMSFSYKNGLPPAADIVFDMRFLGNPHWHVDLRPLTGADQQIQDFIESDPAFLPFMQMITAQLEEQIPLFVQQGRYQVTIAFGCTGGRHRSVASACWLADWATKQKLHSVLLHRELR